MHTGAESTEKSGGILNLHNIVLTDYFIICSTLRTILVLFPSSNFHIVVFFCISQYLSPIKARSTEAPRFS